jgi:two-component system phosphate regulon response regulator OmpR
MGEMGKAAHIVVVDDEPDIREMLQEYLETQGFRVTAADGGETLREIMAAQHVDLVVLDITMPGEDGLSLARFLREKFDLGIIMLTGASDVVDRIIGLEVGADDYLAKPVDLRELLARVKSVLRRMGARAAAASTSPAEKPGETIRFGKCTLDLGAHRLIDDSGAEVPITAMEFDLMRAFAERPNRVLSRDQLLELAHNRGWEPFDRSIDIRIARLRRKIEVDPSEPSVLKTVRGAGYIFSPDGTN